MERGIDPTLPPVTKICVFYHFFKLTCSLNINMWTRWRFTLDWWLNHNTRRRRLTNTSNTVHKNKCVRTKAEEFFFKKKSLYMWPDKTNTSNTVHKNIYSMSGLKPKNFWKKAYTCDLIQQTHQTSSTRTYLCPDLSRSVFFNARKKAHICDLIKQTHQTPSTRIYVSGLKPKSFL